MASSECWERAEAEARGRGGGSHAPQRVPLAACRQSPRDSGVRQPRAQLLSLSHLPGACGDQGRGISRGHHSENLVLHSELPVTHTHTCVAPAAQGWNRSEPSAGAGVGMDPIMEWMSPPCIRPSAKEYGAGW